VPGRAAGQALIERGVGHIQIIRFLNFAGALAAFFLAARVIALDRRALRSRRGSWIPLVCTTALLAALLGVELRADRSLESGAWAWAEAAVETALVLALIAACFFLYVREHRSIVDLFEAAEAHIRRARRLEAILELGDELRAAGSVEQVARAAADGVERRLSFRETVLYLLDPADDLLFTAATVGSDRDYDASIRARRIPRGVLEGLLREEFRHGSTYFIDHRHHDWTDVELAYFPSGYVEDGGPGAFHGDDAVFAPLHGDDGRLIGLFDVYDPSDGCIPSEETLQLLGVFATITASAIEGVRHRAELERLAITDGLTGLYNHRHFQETLAHEVGRAERYDLVFSLLMMDLDLFKNVNDRFGHPRGDEALRAVANVLCANARASDFVARYGGEEFVMILPATTAAQAAVLAERIAQGVRGIAIAVPEPPSLSMSIGLAEYPACGHDRESLIAAADAALLFAKRSGRDAVADFTQVSLVELDQSALEGLAFRLEKADIETLDVLAAAVDQRDAFAGERSAGVARAAAGLAAALGLDDAQRDVLRMAALVYDIGKVGIPVEVLNRRGELSPADQAVIRRHPEMGTRLLETTMRLGALLPVVLHHHERWDGAGYPCRLAGEAIPFGARVIAVCDAWQAMVSDRPYRPALAREAAVAELRAGAGSQFDPHLVEAFIGSLTVTGGAAG